MTVVINMLKKPCVMSVLCTPLQVQCNRLRYLTYNHVLLVVCIAAEFQSSFVALLTIQAAVRNVLWHDTRLCLREQSLLSCEIKGETLINMTRFSHFLKKICVVLVFIKWCWGVVGVRSCNAAAELFWLVLVQLCISPQ